MAFIVIITIIIYGVSMVWTWKSLGELEKSKKIAVIVIGMVVTYIITLVIFSISKNGVDYGQVAGGENEIRRVIIAIFSGINSLILFPFISKQLNKIHEGEIEPKELTKKLSILLVIFIVCMFFECGYMKDTQKGILEIYQLNK